LKAAAAVFNVSPGNDDLADGSIPVALLRSIICPES
jgi:hypothetical protein